MFKKLFKVQRKVRPRQTQELVEGAHPAKSSLSLQPFLCQQVEHLRLQSLSWSSWRWRPHAYQRQPRGL